ncbi:MAG TPA: hypothetical protein VI248_01625 [Kineosporiaceae bacterium]
MIVTERCWDDPTLDALVDRLEEPGQAEQRVHLAAKAMTAVRHDPDRLTQLVEAAGDRLVEAVDALRARAGAAARTPRRTPTRWPSSRRRWWRAWKVRGGRRAKAVDDDAWPVFFGLLEEADESAAQALRLVAGRGPGRATLPMSGRQGYAGVLAIMPASELVGTGLVGS